MRVINRQSTAKCNDEKYTLYLLSDYNYTSCTRLAQIMENISHDSVNRFLERERFEPEDIFNEVKDTIELVGGTLSVDDSVLDKPYSDPKKTDLIDSFWSGKHKRTVKGINLISLFYTDINGVSVPVNYRVYDKSENKTKNDYFREMLSEALAFGLSPAWVTGDCWYSSLDNLKFIRKKEINFLFGIESNRRISIERGQYIQVQTLEDWSDDGNMVYLKDYGVVKVYRQLYKKVYRYYIMSTSNKDDLGGINKTDFERVHSAHWCIERYHRAIKQVCNIEKFQVRKTQSIMTHIFCALKGFIKLELMRADGAISHWYEVKRDLFVETMRNFIKNNAYQDPGVNA